MIIEFVSNYSCQIISFRNWGLWNKLCISKLKYNHERLLIICVFIKKDIVVWFSTSDDRMEKNVFISILDKNEARIDFAFHSLKKRKSIFKNTLLPTGRKKAYLIEMVIGFFCIYWRFVQALSLNHFISSSMMTLFVSVLFPLLK